MTAFTGMLNFQPLAETVMVIVTSHSPVISRPICKLNKPIHLISAVINSAAKIRRFALSLQSQEIVIFRQLIIIEKREMDRISCLKLPNGHRQLENDIASHVEYALPSGHDIPIRIFQAAQVVLVAHIREVVDNHGQLGDFLAFNQDFSSG